MLLNNAISVCLFDGKLWVTDCDSMSKLSVLSPGFNEKQTVMEWALTEEYPQNELFSLLN